VLKLSILFSDGATKIVIKICLSGVDKPTMLFVLWFYLLSTMFITAFNISTLLEKLTLSSPFCGCSFEKF
jgi:hypothetical protein